MITHTNSRAKSRDRLVQHTEVSRPVAQTQIGADRTPARIDGQQSHTNTPSATSDLRDLEMAPRGRGASPIEAVNFFWLDNNDAIIRGINARDSVEWNEPSRATTPQPARSVVAAIDDLKSWLSLSDEQVARLVGVSRRSLINWRGGQAPYGSSVRHLRIIHVFVSHLVDRLSTAELAQLWLEGNSGLGGSRLDALSHADHYRLVLSQAEEILFPASTVRVTKPGLGIGTEPEIAEFLESTRQADVTYTPRAPRRPRKIRPQER